MSKLKGKQAEDIAANYLKQQNIKIITRNFHSRFGEIDLIGLDKEILTFIEVRYRKDEQRLTAIETIDQNKCKKIIKTSEAFLNKHKKYQPYYCRFDVITITGEFSEPVILWIKDSFQA
ncbi:MAG: YraN family protein [Gammaproteobacteria bacterium]|jgi:putative endonuclease